MINTFLIFIGAGIGGVLRFWMSNITYWITGRQFPYGTLVVSEHLLNSVINYLINDAKIRGISVFRAISGFGETGNHTASLIDLSLNLPLAVEFFDSKERVMPALEHLSSTIKHEHIVFWEAKAND